MYGFYNRLLKINLTNKTYHVEEIADEILKKYLGGKGLGSYLLLKEIPKGVCPMSEDNKLIFTTGPIADTKMMGSSRYGVFTKSPLTGIYSESYSGGNVAPALKKTGYDAIVIEGISKEKVYLEISDERVEFHDASHLWGKDTYETEDSVLAEVAKKGAQAVVIGPAGENLVRYACIENNYWRSAGRTGVGTVMGKKNLKAIVFHGNSKCELADQDLLDSYVKDLVKRGKNDPGAKAYKNTGTPMLVAIMNKVEGFPTQYWHKGSLDTWENISAEKMQREMEVTPRACPPCFFACGKLSKIKEGPYKGLTIEGPEYETIYSFGGLCCIDDIKAIAYLNDLCDRFGIDTITTGNMVAFAIEASKAGKLDLDIDYGQVDKIARLIEDIVYKRGAGAVLAEGIKTASKQLGLENIAIHVKGLEPAGYDPRILKGMGLAYATSDRGACHLRSTFYKPELAGIIDPDTTEGKAKLFIEYEDRLALYDALILCRFYRDIVLWEDLSTIIQATTGLKLNTEELRKIASNIVDATRIFNIREGITKKDDTLPERFFEEPIGSKSKVITREQLETMLSDYYSLRGWSTEGVPERL
ncbi:MAG: aldehyde:ferredoxin oxidoreductase [Thermosediminibacterales bacterium]|nr:aldehyde:ferredoxin oxidoreductase [Thermosediminibacterales bacterium]MDK2835946.1 aldehyde:ferredoxin oxidoreductase [Thermosediminibacterales bacterium]